MSLSSRLNPNRGNLHVQTLFLFSPVAFSRAIGDFSVAVLFMVRPNLPMAIFKKSKSGDIMKKKVIYQITRHKISKIEITSEEEERAVAEANRDFERIDNRKGIENNCRYVDFGGSADFRGGKSMEQKPN